MKKLRKIISALMVCSMLSSGVRGMDLNETQQKTLAAVAVTAAVGIPLIVILKKIFSNKGIKAFDKKEQTWIKFLMGEQIDDKSFRFNSCNEFRTASNNDLEGYHDFIQVVFPNLEKSGYANQDLYLNKNLKKWQDLMQDLEIRLKIQENLRLNLIRILTFFGFEVTLGDSSEIIKLKAKTDGVAFKPGNHNGLRLTRVLICLKIFGLNREHQLIIDSINSNKEIMKLVNGNSTLKTSYEFWLNSKKTACLF